MCRVYDFWDLAGYDLDRSEALFRPNPKNRRPDPAFIKIERPYRRH